MLVPPSVMCSDVRHIARSMSVAYFDEVSLPKIAFVHNARPCPDFEPGGEALHEPVARLRLHPCSR